MARNSKQAKQTAAQKYDVLVNGGRASVTAGELKEVAKLDMEQRRLALPEREAPANALTKRGSTFVGPVHQTTISLESIRTVRDLTQSDACKITHAFVQTVGGDKIRSFMVREFTHQEQDKNGKMRDKYRYHLFTQEPNGQITWRGGTKYMSRSDAMNPIYLMAMMGSDTYQASVTGKPRWSMIENESPAGFRND